MMASQYGDVATWRELKALRTIIGNQNLKIAALRREMNVMTEWHDGDTKRVFMNKDGRKVLMKLTFVKSKDEPIEATEENLNDK